jgi:DNA-binding protein H-NS
MVDDEDMRSVLQLVENWEYPKLLRLREVISETYQQKADAARETVVAKMATELQQLGMSVDDFVAMRSKRKRAARTPAVPKYRSPEGREWSGRGPTPKWIRELEEAGGNREDFLINVEG